MTFKYKPIKYKNTNKYGITYDISDKKQYKFAYYTGSVEIQVNTKKSNFDKSLPNVNIEEMTIEEYYKLSSDINYGDMNIKIDLFETKNNYIFRFQCYPNDEDSEIIVPVTKKDFKTLFPDKDPNDLELDDVFYIESELNDGDAPEKTYDLHKLLDEKERFPKLKK